MGIDAEMFVRIRGREHWLSEDQCLRKAYELASTVGHEEFFISRVNDKNAIIEPRHCLTIAAPFVDKYGDEPERVGKVAISQDSCDEPYLFAGPDEQFIEVHMYGRYYGPGYERGNWPLIRAIAEWCEKNIPGGEVYYGGDSSGVCFAPFDHGAREAMNDHFLTNGRRPYVHGRGIDNRFAIECPTCKVGMYETGWGGGPKGYTLFRCDGCGQQAVKDASRLEWYAPGIANAMGEFAGR